MVKKSKVKLVLKIILWILIVIILIPVIGFFILCFIDPNPYRPNKNIKDEVIVIEAAQSPNALSIPIAVWSLNIKLARVIKKIDDMPGIKLMIGERTKKRTIAKAVFFSVQF